MSSETNVQSTQTPMALAETSIAEKARKPRGKSWPSKLAAAQDQAREPDSSGYVEQIKVKMATGQADTVTFSVVGKKGKQATYIVDAPDPLLQASTLNLLAAAAAGHHKVKVKGNRTNGGTLIANEIELKLKR